MAPLCLIFLSFSVLTSFLTASATATHLPCPPQHCSTVWVTDPITFFIGLSLSRREGTSLSPEQKGENGYCSVSGKDDGLCSGCKQMMRAERLPSANPHSLTWRKVINWPSCATREHRSIQTFNQLPSFQKTEPYSAENLCKLLVWYAKKPLAWPLVPPQCLFGKR